MQIRDHIDSLLANRTLSSQGYREILESEDRDALEYLYLTAREVAQKTFGCGIFVRGLIEITNRCANNCLYCGIRALNSEVERYSLNHEQIIDCCHIGYVLGLRSFVMQGGENPAMSDEWMVELVAMIRDKYPDTAITLSLGERSEELYRRLFDAGANRYLLRHESHNPEHYSKLHPSSMSLDNRLLALDTLKRIGFQTGTGIMVGSPYQSIDNIVEDIEFIEHFRPEMIGIGPFIPHHATPFADFKAGSVEMTLKLISIFRLITPQALIPATTALATLSDDGQQRGILAGANVVMPNISPSHLRANYALYDNKASFGSESGEGIRLLSQRLAKIGYSINYDRGDYKG